MNTPQASPDLASLRVQIDSIDQQLLTLLNQRALVAEQVGEVKKREGTPFFRPDRVAQVIDKITHANPGPLKGAHVAAIWREIMSACLALESPQRVAVLGPEGAFCEQAAIEFFGGAADLMYCANFDEVFHATPAGSAQYGVVGAENSTAGGPTRKRLHNARLGCPSTCRMPSAARCPAIPKAHAWPPPTLPGRPSPANVQPLSSACTSSPTPFRTTPTTAPASPSSACRTRCRRHRPRARTAPALWCRCPTALAPCTTCWCHSRRTVCP